MSKKGDVNKELGGADDLDTADYATETADVIDIDAIPAPVAVDVEEVETPEEVVDAAEAEAAAVVEELAEDEDAAELAQAGVEELDEGLAVEDVREEVADEDDADEPPAALVDLERRIEAILMVADEPQSLVTLATALGAPVPAVRQTIERLVADYDGEAGGPRRGFELREVGGGWRIYVRPEHDGAVRDFVLTQSPTKLSQAALETLAVIAYKQPISRGAIASIRAVNVDSVVRTLLGRGLIAEAYTDSMTGAIHYETTPLLLTQLGINSLDELPPISPLLADGSEGFEDIAE